MSLLQIVGGNVFDALHGDVIRHGVVCIEGDRITAIGSASAIPTGGRNAQVLSQPLGDLPRRPARIGFDLLDRHLSAADKPRQIALGEVERSAPLLQPGAE